MRPHSLAYVMSLGMQIFYMYWTCPILTLPFGIFVLFSGNYYATSSSKKTPEVGLLMILNDLIPHTHARILLCLLFFYACKVILLNWRSAATPSVQQFYQMVNGKIPKFKLIYQGQACPRKCYKIWQPWLDILASFWGNVTASQMSSSIM